MFRNAKYFMSNFYPTEIRYRKWGKSYCAPTVEHAFQAQKAITQADHEAVLRQATPGKAKRKARTIALREDWEAIKIPLMKWLLERKFLDPDLRAQLKEQKGEIVEENNWHDNFWGACTCGDCAETPKQNVLGKLLMEIRDGPS